VLLLGETNSSPSGSLLKSLPPDSLSSDTVVTHISYSSYLYKCRNPRMFLVVEGVGLVVMDHNAMYNLAHSDQVFLIQRILHVLVNLK